MQVKSSAEWSIRQYFQPSLSYHLPLRSLFCLFLVTVLHSLPYFKHFLTIERLTELTDQEGPLRRRSFSFTLKAPAKLHLKMLSAQNACCL